MPSIKGTASDITFQNEDNGYTVLKLKTDDQIFTCVGVMFSVERGESLLVKGEWENHSRFGRQFRVKSYEKIRPTTISGIKTLLSSGLIKNIGEYKAQKIIDKFGADTLDIMDRSPERLRDVEGIGKKTLDNIIESWRKQRHMKSLMLFLQSFGITVNLINKIYKAYGDGAKEKISSNPYSLIDDIWGVGFKKADAIAEKAGFRHDSFRRIRAGLIYTLRESSSNGNVFLPRTELLKKASEILEVDTKHVLFSLDHIIKDKKVIEQEGNIYLPQYYYAENDTAENICRILNHKIPDIEGIFSKPYIGPWFERYSRNNKWNADPKQADAFFMSTHSSLMLLTGGPGTGKTTALKVIVSFFREHNLTVALAAPTGRAAQRMGSLCGLKARTIHRLLEFRPSKEGYFFGRNRNNPVKADLVVIDETSMADLMLMRSLLSAVSDGTRVLLIGDSDQLPSIGAGSVLKDLIESGTIPHIHLTTIFRQAAQSRIITAAHEIVTGRVPKFTNGSNSDCFFLKEEDPQECLKTILELTVKRLPDRYGLDPLNDIQVLSPMHRGILGTRSINERLQEKLNPSQEKIELQSISFRSGDKVIQMKNNYDKEVFNGDIGIITEVRPRTGLTVNFYNKSVFYEKHFLDELSHAYCITIHKSQGCEFRAVVIPVMTQHFVMLQRNLIYTALTRARNLCIFVGTYRALSIAVNNNNDIERYSDLCGKIK